MEIKPNDIISGSLYLKLLNDYKRYDARQKNIIADLRNQVDFLQWETEDLRIALEESDYNTIHDKLLRKLKNQRVTLKDYLKKIQELTAENESMKSQIDKMNQERQESE